MYPDHNLRFSKLSHNSHTCVRLQFWQCTNINTKLL